MSGTTVQTRRAQAGSRVARALALSALASAAVLLLFFVTSSGGHYRVTATFEQVNGLIEGARVTTGGLEIGKVEQIDLDRAGYPRVRMSIDDDFKLREGATAQVKPFSVSGTVSRFVDLRQGGGAPLGNGATLDRDETDEVVEFDEALATLGPRARADVRSFFDGFDQAVAGRGPDIERTLRNSAAALGATADVADQLSSDEYALQTLVARGREVVAAVQEDPGSLSAFADRLAEFLGTTARRQLELDAVVARTPAGLRAAREALARLDSSVSTLRGFVADARPGVRRLRETSPELRAALDAARPAIKELDRLVATGPADLRRIRPLLPTAQQVLGRSIPALRDTQPILNHFRVRLPDAFGFFSGWADFTAAYDANGHGGRVGLVHTNTPRNLLGPDDSGPGRVARPFLRDPGVLEGEPWTDYRDSFVGGGG